MSKQLKISKEYLDQQLKQYELRKVANDIGFSTECIRSYLKKIGLPTAKQYQYHRENDSKFNHNFFEKINSEKSAYWLGFIMADGCIIDKPNFRLSIDLGIKDIHHLEKFKNNINAVNKLSINHRGKSIKINLCSKILCNDLIKFGCIPRKSLILEFPNGKIPKYLLHHFVRGYFDGDGSVFIFNQSKNKKNIGINFIGTKNFLTNISLLLNMSHIQVKETGNVYRWRTSGNKVIEKIYQYMYKDATIFLDRKKNIFDSHFDYLKEIDKYGSIQRNSTKIKTSKYKGVYRTKNNLWYAYIHHKNKRIHLGSFSNEIDAAKVYDNKARFIYKDRAILNFGV